MINPILSLTARHVPGKKADSSKGGFIPASARGWGWALMSVPLADIGQSLKKPGGGYRVHTKEGRVPLR